MAERLKAAVLKISIAIDFKRFFCHPKYVQDTHKYHLHPTSTRK